MINPLCNYSLSAINRLIACLHFRVQRDYKMPRNLGVTGIDGGLFSVVTHKTITACAGGVNISVTFSPQGGDNRRVKIISHTGSQGKYTYHLHEEDTKPSFIKLIPQVLCLKVFKPGEQSSGVF